jgi:hypothetical protein
MDGNNLAAGNISGIPANSGHSESLFQRLTLQNGIMPHFLINFGILAFALTKLTMLTM